MIHLDLRPGTPPSPRLGWADARRREDLPLRAEPATALTRSPAAQEELRTETVPARSTILVVDDQVDILDSMKVLLESALPGVEVCVAPSAREALGILRGRRVSLVITDLRMPEMDGLDLVGALRRSAPQVPVFLMTAYVGSERAEAAKASAAVQEFFAKPLDTERLVAEARRYLGA